MAVKIQPLANRQREIRLAISAMILSAAAWGLGMVMSKAAVGSIPPVLLLSIQLIASTLTLWLVTIIGRVRFRRRDLRHGWTGLFEPGLAYLISLIGYQFTTASNAALVSALEPFIILGLAVLLLRERPTRFTVLLLIISIIGVLLVTGSGESGRASLFGDGLVFIGTACAAVYVVLSRNSVATVHPLPLAAAQQTVGLGLALLVLPFALLLGEGAQFGNISVGAVLFAALTGIIQYSLAFGLYLTALRFIPATQAALYLTLIPVFGVSGGVLLLAESLSWTQGVGAGIILAALILYNHRAR